MAPNVRANLRELIQAVARGIPLPLGSVNNRRSLVALDNLVDFLQICIKHPAAANQTFLVRDHEDISTANLIRRMADAMNKKAWLVPVPASILKACADLLGKHDVIQRLCSNLQVDNTKVRSLLGWEPPVSVNEGLRRATLEWRK